MPRSSHRLRPGEEEVLTQKRVIQRRDDDPVVLLETRLVTASRMSTATYIKTCFTIPGVEIVRINRKTLRGVQKVYNIDKAWWLDNYGPEAHGIAGAEADDEKLSELIEAWIERDFGPGDYDLCPVYKGMLYKHKWLVLGEAKARDETQQGDIDAEMALHVKRLSNITTIREWRKVLDDAEGGEEMKPEELIAVAQALRPSGDGSNGMQTVLIEMLRLEREQSARLLVSVMAPKPSALGEVLEPIVALLKEKVLSPRLLEGLLFRRPARDTGERPNPPAAPGWLDQLLGALGPLAERVAPVVVQTLLQHGIGVPGQPAGAPVRALRVLPGGAAAPAEPPAAPHALPAAEGGSMADNPELRAVLDVFVEELRKPEGERDLPALVASLQALPLTADRTLFDHVVSVAFALPAIQAMAVKAIDPRLSDAATLPGTTALLAYVRGIVRAQEAPDEPGRPEGSA